MKNILIFVVVICVGWVFFHHPKANWQGQLASADPLQTQEYLPMPWVYKDLIFTARAKYRIQAVVLSKHHYWAGDIEDTIAPYDLALGWGPMSDAAVINQLKISQGGRWYDYSWKNNPPIALSEIISHSANHHIIPANKSILKIIKSINTYDVIELDGYLVDVTHSKDNWNWHTSLSRTDTAASSCELFWVTNANKLGTH